MELEPLKNRLDFCSLLMILVSLFRYLLNYQVFRPDLACFSYQPIIGGGGFVNAKTTNKTHPLKTS